jgi:hypothetical protein
VYGNPARAGVGPHPGQGPHAPLPQNGNNPMMQKVKINTKDIKKFVDDDFLPIGEVSEPSLSKKDSNISDLEYSENSSTAGPLNRMNSGSSPQKTPVLTKTVSENKKKEPEKLDILDDFDLGGFKVV